MVEFLLALALLAPRDGACSAQVLIKGTCSISGSSNGSGVDLQGNITIPGGGDSAGDSEVIVDGGDAGSDLSSVRCDYRPAPQCREVGTVVMLGDPAVTLSDIAHFRPEAGEWGMEPSGWAVTKLPANFFSAASTQVLSGSVLGKAAQVRFEPVAWAWDYGDGHVTTTAVPGSRWADLGLPEFDVTPTSHVFTRGEYQVRLTVQFRAWFHYGNGPWVEIPGLVSVDTAPIAVTAVAARTVLVEQDCLAHPRGPGC